jgi:phage baseplate assembly protein W
VATPKPIQTPIGITLPIRDSNSGYFEQSYDTLTQTKSNIINLLNTRQGERRMQPTFGSRLWSLLFEQNTDNLPEIASNVVKEDISMWIPNITVIDVTANLYKSDQTSSDRDIYRLQVAVVFMLNMTKQQDTVTITIDNVTA